jgi:hypothetical protein
VQELVNMKMLLLQLLIKGLLNGRLFLLKPLLKLKFLISYLQYNWLTLGQLIILMLFLQQTYLLDMLDVLVKLMNKIMKLIN